MHLMERIDLMKKLGDYLVGDDAKLSPQSKKHRKKISGLPKNL